MHLTKTDPSGRFEKFSTSLGKGAYKDVFKAFDQEEGVEVAWNQLRLENLGPKDVEQIASEIHILRGLHNDNIINLFHSWVNQNANGHSQVCFVTELMTSGTLDSYVRKTKGLIKPKIIRNWGRQVLQGLAYLHTRNPPIIHRDLKCQNIFINGNNGQAKIGDLGLATMKRREHLSSVLGTPAFMAPEFYDEKYDEKVDIYAFGMVILEIATKEYPYTECVNQAQIYRKVTTGVKPAALNNVVDPETLQIIQLCLEHDPKIRPSAVDLLDHPFFSIVNTNPDGMPSMHSNESLSHREPKAHERMPSDISEAAVPVATKVDAPNHTYFIMERRASSLERTSTSTCTVISTLGITADEVTLTMVYNTGHAAQEIKFPFDLSQDTATDVVSELVDGKLINAEDDQLVRRKIEEAVRSILIRQRANDSNIPVEVDNIEPEARVVLLPGSNIVEEKISPKRPATSSPVYISAQPAQEPLHVPLHIPVPIGIPPKETANFADFHTFSPMLIPDAWESDLDARLRALQEINLLGFDNSNARPKSVGKSSSSLPNGSATHITGNSITGSLSASPTHFEFPPSESISSPPAK